jgi:hypothetical protein
MNLIQPLSARTLTKMSVVATTALLATPVLAGPAQAGDNDREVAASRSCASGVIKVKAKADDGRIEVEGEVDTNRRGQTWSWTIRRDGTVAARGTNQTAGRSGSFSVERKIGNPPGRDKIAFRAVRSGTGQTCRVVVRF